MASGARPIGCSRRSEYQLSVTFTAATLTRTPGRGSATGLPTSRLRANLTARAE